MLRLPCTGRVDVLHVLKAFELGADGVMVVACKKGECAFETGNLAAERRIMFVKKLLNQLGLGSDRVNIYFLSSGEADKFVAAVKDMVEKVKKLGPSPLKK